MISSGRKRRRIRKIRIERIESKIRGSIAADFKNAENDVFGVRFLRFQSDGEIAKPLGAPDDSRPISMGFAAVFLFQLGEHDNHRRIVLPNHAPKVIKSVRKRRLAADVMLGHAFSGTHLHAAVIRTGELAVVLARLRMNEIFVTDFALYQVCIEVIGMRFASDWI